MGYETRREVIDEIKLCLENDGDLYRSSRWPYELNLMRKLMTKKNYVHSLAIQGWLNIVTQYLKIYARENVINDWSTILEPAERYELAAILASEFHDECLNGEYDGVELTKKTKFDSTKMQKGVC